MLKRVLHGDLVGITMSKLIASFGMGLVGVFIPLLLLSNGLKLWHVCAFYAGYAVCKLVVNYPSARMINRYGARLGLIVGNMATVVFMVLLTLYVTYEQPWLLVAMAFTMALQNSFMWNSQHLHIARVMDAARKGRDLATIETLLRIVGVVTPLIGGLIAVWLGQVWLTALAALFVAIAIVPVWRLDTLAGGHQQASSLRYSLRQAPWRDVIANFAYNSHTLVGVMVWPIYLAVFIPSFQNIGIITTVSSLIAVVVLYFAGKRGDSGKTYRVLVEGTAASSAVHVARVFASSNPVTITVISTLYDVALSYQQNPWTSLYYAHTRKRGINYIMAMEIAGDLAYVLMWGLLGAVAYTTGDGSFFTVAFGVAAVVAWLCLLIRRESPALASAS